MSFGAFSALEEELELVDVLGVETAGAVVFGNGFTAELAAGGDTDGTAIGLAVGAAGERLAVGAAVAVDWAGGERLAVGAAVALVEALTPVVVFVPVVVLVLPVDMFTSALKCGTVTP